ncbi:MAG: primosomal protein N' [Firmicutes bacterium]|nr:primosomal protein N' [Bacillota bacterium]
MRYADIIIENKGRHTDNLFTYRVNDASVQVGDRVTVPFGPHNREKTGYVYRIRESADPGTGGQSCPPEKIKDILCRDDSIPLTEEIMITAGWMKQRYGITFWEGVRCFIPAGPPAKAGKEKEPYQGLTGSYEKPKHLTEEQQVAADRIGQAIREEKQENFLIHGVTSSGKTEVYMEAIDQCLNRGKTAIMLVPEIALTTQMMERFAGRFGKDRLAVMHSKLTRRERYDEWQRIRHGKAQIVVGARMGVFAPLENIGVIIMDEEHEATYKADMTPKYETVDVALKRLKFYNGVLILGSATPSVVSYERCREGIYQLIELKHRYNQTPLPEVKIADMREELKAGNATIFSRALHREMKECLASGRQVILFQNRRGYSSFISCRECGTVLKCPKCGISLTYHKRSESAVCHYCGRKFPVPERCPECGSSYIRYFGIGTEQVEEAASSFFPEAPVDRLDLDAIKTRRDLDRILGRFARGETKILIGTQLVAKGLDFQNVGLVGVIAADATLNIPDYRSAERTFQLVTQVAGRAGRGDQQGKVIVQTYEPEHYALTAAKNHDYSAFFRQEIKMRQFMDYPPFTDLILVNFTAAAEETALAAAERCRKYMERAMGAEYARQILDPRVSVNFKGDDFRYYILIKCPRGSRNLCIYYLDNFAQILMREKAECSMNIDVNPYSTL